MERSRKFLLSLLAPLLAAAPVAAQSNAVCDELRGRLANITEVIGTPLAARQYSGAIARQNLEIRRLQDDMRDQGCSYGSMTMVDPEDPALCDDMENSLEQMQQNLDHLMDQRSNAHEAPDPNDLLRAQLQTELRENGCDEPASSAPDTTISTQPPTPEQQAARTDTFIQPMDRSGGPPQGYFYDQPAPKNYPSNGAYGANLQTVCVRTCDGGFFPLTTSATPLDFQRDAETCARMCPGVPTELYFRYLPGQESSEMISAATGARYSAMPYAFAYRKRAPGEKSSCGCNMSAYYEEMRREKAMTEPQADKPRGSITTIETRKPQLPAPQSATAAPQPKQPADRPYDPSTRRIRQVGPQFLAPDQGRIDLKHPLTPGPQPEQ